MCHDDFQTEDGLAANFKKQYPRGNFLQEVEYRLKLEGMGRMPKDSKISKEEQDAILKYLSDFSNKVK